MAVRGVLCGTGNEEKEKARHGKTCIAGIRVGMASNSKQQASGLRGRLQSRLRATPVRYQVKTVEAKFGNREEFVENGLQYELLFDPKRELMCLRRVRDGWVGSPGAE